MFGDFKIIKKCKTTNARVATFELNNNVIDLPIFMPVATYGAMKGVKTEELGENMILSNTYHLRNLNKNVKSFMKYKWSMLTDSGGFQIGSLKDVMVEEEGVMFSGKMFTPEDSMNIQMTLGADIIMQLDEVVNPKEDISKIEVATKRSVRWLKRCIREVYYDKTVKRTQEYYIQREGKQILFPIIQGGLDEGLRKYSINEILKTKPLGLAIGGLSGGEEKSEFARIVLFCINNLPEDIPRYLMGVGYPEDVLICAALGSDMSDCVYPARTARFGRAFSDYGDLYLTPKYKEDMNRLTDECECYTCINYSRSYLSMLKGTTNFCSLITIHNLTYMRNLTKRIRQAILEERFPEFIKEYLKKRYKNIPEWITSILKEVHVTFD